MDTSLSQKVKTRLFLGALLSPDVRIALESHPLYKQNQIEGSKKLETVHHEGKDYIGLFIEENSVSLDFLRATKESLSSLMSSYELSHHHLQVKIFPQLLLC
jgi:hypothetical protein